MMDLASNAGLPQISAIQSQNRVADVAALRLIFGTQVEVQEGSGFHSMIDGNNSLIIADQTMSVACKFAVLRGDQRSLESILSCANQGVITIERSGSDINNAFVTVCLPGGSSIIVVTNTAWADKEIRSCILQRFMFPSSDQRSVRQMQTDDDQDGFAEAKQNARDSEGPTASTASTTTITPTTPTTATTAKKSPTRNSFKKQSSANGNASYTATRDDINSKFPSLNLQLSGHGLFQPNTQEGVPFETDLFVGKLLFVMRPDNPKLDPFWNERIFSKKKRRMILQLQGKLKYKPAGTLYAGIQTSKTMKLGLIANGLCGILLRFMKSFNASIHYSFGDATEKPHIVFPANTFFERFVITPEGETPPPMDEDFPESSEARKRRMSGAETPQWNDTDTYSMSFHSMYADFPSWAVVNLPVKDMSLKTFWGDASASIVLYEHNSEKKKHDDVSTIVSLEIQHQLVSGSSRARDESASLLEFGQGDKESTYSASPSVSDREDDSDDDLEFFDTLQNPLIWPLLDSRAINSSTSSRDLTRIVDSCCPCWIDMIGRRGKYVTVYAFTYEPTHVTILRSSSEAYRYLEKVAITETAKKFSPRMSSEESKRRDLGLRFAAMYQKQADSTTLMELIRHKSRADKQFLRRNHAAGSYVCRAHSDKHWVEECCKIEDEHIHFFHPQKLKTKLRFKMSCIVEVSKLNKDEHPVMFGFSFLSLKTFGRTIYLMFLSGTERDKWATIICKYLADFEYSTFGSKAGSQLIEVEDPMAEYLQNSSMWDCGKRRILNARQFAFTTCDTSSKIYTLRLAEEALRRAARIRNTSRNDRDLQDFLDAAAALKKADVHILNETEKLAFFLNVYHIMIIHAFLVLGPPTTGLAWVSYFNTIAYQVSDEIFSLSELEHNIIRSKMTFPSQLLSRFVLPKSGYSFALSTKDFRINFALHSGSTSHPVNTVPIYVATNLEEQLSSVSKSFLANSVSASSKSRGDVNIYLPKICQWFASDFGDGSISDVLSSIHPYLSSELKASLQAVWNSRSSRYEIPLWNVKYLPFSFECRHLSVDETNGS